MNKNPRRKMFFIFNFFQVSNTNAAWTLTNMQATLFILYLSIVTLAAKKPNIVLVLTDDQDVVLGSMVSLLTQNILFNSFLSYFNKNQRYKQQTPGYRPTAQQELQLIALEKTKTYLTYQEGEVLNTLQGKES